MISIRQKLLLWLVGGMLVTTMVAGVGLYLTVREEVGELFDYQLQQIAAAIPTKLEAQKWPTEEIDSESDVVVQVWDKHGTLLYASDQSEILPRFPDIGLSTVTALGDRWRVMSISKPDRYILAAQTISARNELVFESVMRSLLPFVIMIPVLGLLIGFVVKKALLPLRQITQEVDKRSQDAMQSIVIELVPYEIKPLVEALNKLLLQHNLAMDMQRTFIADAAHELRSPLTALKLQLQLAERAKTDEQRTSSFAKLQDRLDRTTHLVHQMLTLARHDRHKEKEVFKPVEIAHLIMQVVADYAASADSKNIHLAAKVDEQPMMIHGDLDGLRIMMGNLIDNALRYTPAGGRVDVRAIRSSKNGGCIFHVMDTGSGILPEERERVFDRFYRCETTKISGSGLGLAIVKSIVMQHRARIYLNDNPVERGLLVTVVFPE